MWLQILHVPLPSLGGHVRGRPAGSRCFTALLAFVPSRSLRAAAHHPPCKEALASKALRADFARHAVAWSQASRRHRQGSRERKRTWNPFLQRLLEIVGMVRMVVETQNCSKHFQTSNLQQASKNRSCCRLQLLHCWRIDADRHPLALALARCG